MRSANNYLISLSHSLKNTPKTCKQSASVCKQAYEKSLLGRLGFYLMEALISLCFPDHLPPIYPFSKSKMVEGYDHSTIKPWPISVDLLHICYTLRPFQSEFPIHHPNQERSCMRIALGISIKNKSLSILKIMVVSSIMCFHHFFSSFVHAITSSQNRKIINHGKIIIALDKSYFEEVFYE